MIAVAGLMGAWLFNSATTTVQVLVLTHDLEAGETLTALDLRVVEVGSFTGAGSISPGQQHQIVGATTRGPLPAGTIVNEGLFVDRGQLVPPGLTVVGARLERGAIPVGDIRSGDPVVLLATRASSDEPPAEAITEGSIWAIERSDGSFRDQLAVSLLIPLESQGEVAQAAADGLLRLALVGEHE